MTKEVEYAATLLKAAEYAAEMHRDQRRKSVEASPYINHPIQVASIIANVGKVSDVSVLAAALLHDTIEDTEATGDALVERFGRDIRNLVEEVTDDKTLPKAERKRLQIEHTPHMSDGAKLIKIADKTCNVRDIGSKPPGDWSIERRREYFDRADKVVAGCRGVNAAMEELFDQSVARSRTIVGE